MIGCEQFAIGVRRRRRGDNLVAIEAKAGNMVPIRSKNGSKVRKLPEHSYGITRVELRLRRKNALSACEGTIDSE